MAASEEEHFAICQKLEHFSPKNYHKFWFINMFNTKILAQSAGAVKYTNCNSADEYDSPNECPNFDTKQSDGEASVMLVL